MPIIYTTHFIQIATKKKGLTVRQGVSGSFNNPIHAYECACKHIRDILVREKYFNKEPDLEKVREQETNAIMESDDPWASKYYDMDNLISNWCPLVPELNIKRHDVRVTDNDLS